MALPFVTELDPEIEAEGGIDPLGLAVIADRLANDMIPGVTARMLRPRFVTLVTVGSRLTEDMPERGKDGTPAYVAFEWLALQAFACMEDQTGLLGIQGMLKAKGARRDGAAMSARRYLKAPTVYGVNAAYKRLARALELIDDDMRWRTEGERLLATWQKEQGLDGFLSGTGGTAGARLAEKLRGLIRGGLANGYADCPKGEVLEFFQSSLHPGLIGKAEGEHLRRLIGDPSGGTRGEFFRLLDEPAAREARTGALEATFLRFIKARASSDLAFRLEAIDAFEKAACPITDAFDWIRHLSTSNPTKPVTDAAFATSAPDLSRALRSRLHDACEALRGTSSLPDIEALARDFEPAVDAASLFHTVLKRHQEAQRRKPPQGKRVWIERTAEGGGVIRGQYKLPAPPLDDGRNVFSYRTRSVASFLDDLRVGA